MKVPSSRPQTTQRKTANQVLTIRSNPDRILPGPAAAFPTGVEDIECSGNRLGSVDETCARKAALLEEARELAESPDFDDLLKARVREIFAEIEKLEGQSGAQPVRPRSVPGLPIGRAGPVGTRRK